MVLSLPSFMHFVVGLIRNAIQEGQTVLPVRGLRFFKEPPVLRAVHHPLLPGDGVLLP